MQLKSSSNITIAKSAVRTPNTGLEPLDYPRWVAFIEQNKELFLWNEYTEKGKESLQNIKNVPDKFKKRVLASLNKKVCFSEYDNATGDYNISVTFYDELNWITIQFARNPKPDDLPIFIEMAAYLDAYLLMDGNTIIDEDTLKELG